MRRKGKQVIWPAYFDSEYSWGQGRRISKKLAIRDVKSEEIMKAAEDLGLKPILNPNSSFSKYPWIKTGYVLVDKKDSKLKVLKELAQIMKNNRTSK